MPNTNLEQALATGERIRKAFAAFLVEPLLEPVTVSAGVAELAAGEQGDALIRRVDEALFEAKRSGRNCVVGG